MIKVYCFMIWIIFSFYYSISNFSGNSMCSSSHYIRCAWSFSTFIPSTFKLMSGNRSSPQKSFWKSFIYHFHPPKFYL